MVGLTSCAVTLAIGTATLLGTTRIVGFSFFLL
jgi:hypothetical protein